MALDDFLPRYDFREVHSIPVAAPPARVIAAARALPARESPVFVVLMALRALPELLRPGGARLSLERPVVDQFLEGGFTLLADRRDELVLGGVGRFWRLDGGLRRVGAPDWTAWAEPGYAKAVTNLRAEPGRLSTETRVQATDEGARRAFARYWFAIRVGSGAIRRDWLRAIRRRAEREGLPSRHAG